MEKDIAIRNILLTSELERIDNLVSFNFAVFKGAAFILKEVYKIDERQMTDVDVIVDKTDYERFVGILLENGYKEIEEGKHSFYKVVCNNFVPVIFDVHSDIFGFGLRDFEVEDVSGFKNLKTFSDADLFIISILHAILNHAFIDEGLKDLFRRLKKRCGDDFELVVEKRVRKKSFEFVVRFVLGEITGKRISFPLSLKDIVIYPFLKIASRKHFILNEYIISFIYNPCDIVNFLKKGRKGFKNLFSRLLGKMD